MRWSAGVSAVGSFIQRKSLPESRVACNRRSRKTCRDAGTDFDRSVEHRKVATGGALSQAWPTPQPPCRGLACAIPPFVRIRVIGCSCGIATGRIGFGLQIGSGRLPVQTAPGRATRGILWVSYGSALSGSHLRHRPLCGDVPLSASVYRRQRRPLGFSARRERLLQAGIRLVRVRLRPNLPGIRWIRPDPKIHRDHHNPHWLRFAEHDVSRNFRTSVRLSELGGVLRQQRHSIVRQLLSSGVLRHGASPFVTVHLSRVIFSSRHHGTRGTSSSIRSRRLAPVDVESPEAQQIA
jgi:hypothetical protein